MNSRIIFSFGFVFITFCNVFHWLPKCMQNVSRLPWQMACFLINVDMVILTKGRTDQNAQYMRQNLPVVYWSFIFHWPSLHIKRYKQSLVHNYNILFSLTAIYYINVCLDTAGQKAPVLSKMLETKICIVPFRLRHSYYTNPYKL